MKRAIVKTKKEHGPDCTCSFCGQKHKVFPFKKGYVCESCADYLTTAFEEETPDDDSSSSDR